MQTGPRLLTVNVLPEYPGFQVFRDLILFSLEQYRQVANPRNVARVGLRYINHLGAAASGSGLGELLKLALDYPRALPSPPQETAVRLVFGFGELGNLSLAVAFPSRTTQGDYGALLDLDFFLADPQRFSLDEFPSWLDRAHDVIYDGFVSTVSEKALDRMKGGVSQHA